MSNYDYLWEDKKGNLSEKISEMWKIPEAPMKEYKSSATIANWLESEGFDVTRNFCGLPTAVLGTYGEGDYTIGFLVEYDALVGLDNDAVPYKKSLGNEAGHACMHCHLGPANVAAAIAFKDYLEKTGEKFKVAVFGTPAEEIIYGKIAIQERGGFDGVDILLTSHVDYQNGALSRPCSPCVYGEFQFNGFSDHGGGGCSKNALDAAEYTMQTVERMMPRYFPGSRLNHIYRNSGVMPSIVPDEALVWVIVRNPDYAKAKEDYQKICEIGKAFAGFTGTTFKEGYISSSNGYLPNDAVANVLNDTIQEMGAPKYTEKEMEELKEFCHRARGIDSFTLDEGIDFYNQGEDIYGQDDGEISWEIPLGRINWAAPEEVALHNWIMAAFAGIEVSKVGSMWASKVLFKSAIKIVESPEIIEKAKKELEERTKGKEKHKAHVENFELFTKKPELFWQGKWHDEIR